jgi:hypothetical protein
MLSTWKRIVASVAMLLAITAAIFAGDRVTLTDGRVVEGTIVQEVDGSVWIKVKEGSREREEFFPAAQVEKIERDAAGGAADDPNEAPKAPGKPSVGDKPKASVPAGTPDEAGGAMTPTDPAEPASNVRRIAVITLGEGGGKDMVGVYMVAEVLKRAIPELEKERVTDVVFRVNSGGGMLLEIQKLSDVIHEEYRPRFRVVGWIESAISAAAMTAHCIPELFFMSSGNYGACTGWFGALQAVEGRDLEEVLFMMERISARGGYDTKIMRAMQIEVPLSATISPTGDVTWYENEEGEIIVNRTGKILTFTADQALQLGFSKGTADTLDELVKMMGYTEYEIVGAKRPNVAYPVSRAEEMQRRFRSQVAEDQKRTNEYFLTYQESVSRAQGLPREDRPKFVGKARQALDQIKRMVKNNENFALLIFNMLPEQFPQWVAEREKELRDLLR